MRGASPTSPTQPNVGTDSSQNQILGSARMIRRATVARVGLMSNKSRRKIFQPRKLFSHLLECMRKTEFGLKNPVKSKIVTCDQLCVTLKHEWEKNLLKLYAQTAFW